MNCKNLAIIDADSIIYLATYNKVDIEPKSATQVLESIDQCFKGILDACETQYYCGFLTDGSFRYKIGKTKEYKGNRKDLAKPNYFNLAKSYLLEEYKCQTIKDYEADDLCIMTVESIKMHHKEYNPIVCSPDKDLKQIAGNFYDYKKQEIVTIDNYTANYNLWCQVLTGDSGDNIPGIPQIGPVKAIKILNGCSNPDEFVKAVQQAYINYYGVSNGIVRFAETYQLVKMLDTFEGGLYTPTIFEKQYNLGFDITEW